MSLIKKTFEHLLLTLSIFVIAFLVHPSHAQDITAGAKVDKKPGKETFESVAKKRLTQAKAALVTSLSNRQFYSFRTLGVSPNLLNDPTFAYTIDFKDMDKEPKGEYIFSEKFDYALGKKLTPASGYLIMKAIYDSKDEPARFLSSLPKLIPLSKMILDVDFVSRLYRLLLLQSAADKRLDLLEIAFLNSRREKAEIQEDVLDFISNDLKNIYLAADNVDESIAFLKVLRGVGKKLNLVDFQVSSELDLANQYIHLGKFDECIKSLSLKELASKKVLNNFKLNVLTAKLSGCYRKSFRYDEAIQLFADQSFESKTFKPDDFFLWSQALLAFLDAGEVKKAVSIDNAIKEASPTQWRDSFAQINHFSVRGVHGESTGTPLDIEAWNNSLRSFGLSDRFFFFVEFARVLTFRGNLQLASEAISNARKSLSDTSDQGSNIIPLLLIEMEVFSRTKNQSSLSKATRELDSWIAKVDSGKTELRFLRNFWLSHYYGKTPPKASLEKDGIPLKSIWFNGVFKVAK